MIQPQKPVVIQAFIPYVPVGAFVISTNSGGFSRLEVFSIDSA
jgi:hypothetical protein